MLVEPENMSTVLVPRETPGPRTQNGSRAEDIRAALNGRLTELMAEHAEVAAELEASGVVDSGDDVADLGTKAFAREQEYALSCTIQGRIMQVERALQRLDAGRYGWCEGCSREIPVARLAAFPSVTQCVDCKVREERR